MPDATAFHQVKHLFRQILGMIASTFKGAMGGPPPMMMMGNGVDTSFAVWSGDGQTLYAVDPATGITLLDPSSGATRTVIPGSVHAPWGIAWASSDQAAS